MYFRKQADKLYERAGLAAQRFRFGSEFRKRKIYARKNGLYGASGRSDYPTFESLTASTRFANLRSERRADEFCREKAICIKRAIYKKDYLYAQMDKKGGGSLR